MDARFGAHRVHSTRIVSRSSQILLSPNPSLRLSVFAENVFAWATERVAGWAFRSPTHSLKASR